VILALAQAGVLAIVVAAIQVEAFDLWRLLDREKQSI
jgi:hypothetical protein